MKIGNWKLKINILRGLGRNRAFGVIALGLLIGAGLVIWWSMAQPDSSKAAWFDDRYKYRQTISITNTGAAQTDFQVAFSLDTQTLITAGKMKSDCSDIVIVTNEGKVLPYWIEKTTASACNTTTTKIWTKLPSIPLISSGTAISFFIYYGNPSAYNAQDGRATFIYFDDFSTNTLGNFWTEADPSSAISVSNGKLTVASGRAAWDQAVYLTSSIARGDYSMEFDQYVSAGTNYFMSGWKDDGAGASYTNFVYGYYEPFAAASSITGEVYEDGSARGAVTATFTTLNEIKVRVRMRNSGGAYYDYSTNGGTSFTNSYTSTYSTESTLHPGWTIYNGNYTFDNFFVRKDAATPPTISAPANEEKSPAPVAYWKFDEGTGNLTNNSAGRFAGTQTGLVSYWNFDANTSWTNDCSTATVTDMVGSNSLKSCPNGSGATTPATGKYSKAVDLNGSSQYLETGTSPGLPTGDFTYAAWIYLDANTDEMIAMASDGAGVNEFNLYVNSSSQLRTAINGTDIVNSATTISTGAWTHVAVTRTNGQIYLYINGVRDANSANDSTTLGFSTCQLLIGTDADATCAGSLGNYLDGKIDDLRVYNIGLNDNQISSLYANGPEGTLSGSTKPTWQTEDQCISGKCLYFNGTTSYVLAAPYSAINTTEGTGLTVGAWVKMTQTGATQVILTKQQNTTNEFFYTLNINSSNQAEFSVGKQNVSGNTATGATTLVVDRWYYVVGTYDGTNVKVFVNSTQDGSTTEGFSSSTQSLASINIGQAYNGTQFFKGFIDEPKIYNYVRTDAQLKTDYNARGGTEGSSSNLGNNITNMPAALANGLTSYWKMDEASWTNNCSTATVLDSSGNGNTGTACPNTTGPTGGAAGKFSFGGSFDGSNDYVNVGNLAATTNGTVSMWINRTAGSQDAGMGVGNFFGRQFDGTSSNLIFGFDDNTNFRPVFYLGGPYGGNPVTATSTVAAATWTHITATWEGTTAKIYVNGVLEGTITNATPDTGGANITIGACYSALGHCGGYFNGKMDEVRMYNRALSSDEVRQLANWAPGPMTYYDFEEGGGGTVFDKSGNGYNGKANNSPTWVTGKYGKALKFNGTNQTVSVAGWGNYAPTQDVTVSFWVNAPNDGGTHNILGAGTDTPDRFNVHFPWSGGQIYWDFGTCCTNGRLSYTPSGYSNVWTHFTLVNSYSGGYMRIYKNGVLEASNTTPGTFARGNYTLYLGSFIDGTSYLMNGALDELKIYNYARTPSQVIEDMNAGHPAGGSPIGSAIAYWKFNEGADNTCSGGTNDACNSGSSGSTLDGAGSGFASPATSTSGWTSAGKFGKALSFDGTNDYISASSEDTFDVTGDMSMSLWFKSSSSTSQMMVAGKHDCGTNNGYFFRQNAQATGDIQFQHVRDNNNPITISGSYNDGNWHHLVGVISGSTSYIYVDGKPRGSQSLSVSYTGNSIPFQIGTVDSNACGFGTSSYNGQIDEVKFYNGALTADQVKIDYNQSSAQVQGAISDNTTYQPQAQNQEYCVPGDSTSCASPIAEWRMETGTGTSAIDTSGNAKTLTLTNSPTWARGITGKGVNMSHNLSDNDYLTRADDSDFDFGAGASFTISGWFALPSLPLGSTSVLLSKYNEAGYKIIYNDVTFEISCALDYDSTWSPTDSSTISFTPDGKWHYVSCVKNANSSLTIYLDGRPGTADSSLTNSTLANSDPLYIGVDADGTTNDWSGPVDQFRIYNYARTASQVAWEYNRGGPVAWWKFDECQNTTANDSAGNSLSGTITISGSGSQTSVGTCTSSGAWYNGVAGKRNYSMNFDGTDDYVTMGDPASGLLDFGSSDFSIGYWIKTSKGTRFDMVQKGSGTGGNSSYGIYWDPSSGLNFHTDNGSGGNSDVATTSVTINDGNWHHILAIRSGTNMYLYLDGQLRATATGLTTRSIASSQNFCLAKHCQDNNYFVNGQMDDVRVYHYALSATQAKTLFSNGAINYAPTTGAP